MSLPGHFWTIAPRLRHSLRPRQVPEPRPWRTTLTDPVAGKVPETGLLREIPGSDEMLVIVHGLGGSTGSHYMLRAAAAAEAAGLSYLRINLRGCDRQSGDFYHAGLTDDLHAALASEDLGRYRKIYVLGYSLGGHVVLKLGTEEADPRLAAVAAVCAPLDLARAQKEIDAPAAWVYRRYLLESLNDIYAAVAARRPLSQFPQLPLPVEQALRIRTLREWDDRIVAPRHGFADAGDYYARASAAPRLPGLRVPALLINAEGDPMVPAHAVRTALADSPSLLEARWLKRGGHVYFPGELVDVQVIDWLRNQ